MTTVVRRHPHNKTSVNAGALHVVRSSRSFGSSQSAPHPRSRKTPKGGLGGEHGSIYVSCKYRTNAGIRLQGLQEDSL